MASKKSTPKKSAKKKSTTKKAKKRSVSKNLLKTQFLKICLGFFFLVALVISAGFAAHYLLIPEKDGHPDGHPIVSKSMQLTEPLRQDNKKTPEPLKKKISEPDIDSVPSVPPKKSVPQNGIKMAKIPEFKKPEIYEIFPDKDFVTPKPTAKPPLDKILKDRPKVAIIIDDLGYDFYIAKQFFELEPNLTFSIIPHSPFQKKIADLIRKKGGEMMLHIPMEPNEYPNIDPGPGALLTSMRPDQLIAQLNENLDTMSDAKGVNGHMGSKLTANSEQMYQIFTILKGRNLYFVDSLTTPDSVCKPSAKLLKVPFAQRDIFIDHFHDSEFMNRQIHRLINKAKEQGQAVGIAHPHKETLNVLKQRLPELKKQVNIVPASQLVR